MFDFLKPRRNEDVEQIEFTPNIQINSSSDLFVECTPNDPNSTSNIIINCYKSKTDRTAIKTRIQWSRFKFIADSKHQIQDLPFITGNAYRCEPADLGSYIRAKITCFDVNQTGSAEVTIGPIMINPTTKKLIQGALYSKSLRSQVRVMQKHQFRDIEMLLTDKIFHFKQPNTDQSLQMNYDIYEPRLELNPKDVTKIYLRFQKDEKNTVKKWLDTIFYDGKQPQKSQSQSMRSHNSGSSKSKIFKNVNCPNKIQIVFLTRQARDLFIFSFRAFICKQSMKNEVILQSIENIQEFRTAADSHRFFQFMSLKTQIYRLYSLAKQLQMDRNQKLKDLNQLEQSIGQMTLTYTKIIQQKGKLTNVDFNQSYSSIIMKKEQIYGKKQMRELQEENKQLKIRLREMNEQLELKNFFQKQNNQSMMFNQTKDPFYKKGPSDSIYNAIGNQEPDANPQKGMFQLSKSYMALLKENQQLKGLKKAGGVNPNNTSRDMINLLESLHEEDEDPTQLIRKLREQNQKLQDKLAEYTSGAMKRQKIQTSMRLNQSIAHQQSMARSQRSMANDSMISRGATSLQSSLNQSLTSQAHMNMLEQKLQEISQNNKKVSKENERLRNQRNQYRQKYQTLKSIIASNQNTLSPQKYRNQDLSTSNIFDRQSFDRLKQQKQYLQNENNGLRKKLQSIVSETNKGDPLIVKKNEQLEKENFKLRKQNQQLKNEISTLKGMMEKMKLQTRSSDGGSVQNYKENDKLKKINVQLLEEIKNLKRDIENKADPLYNSRVIELQNQVNYLKNKKQGFQYDQSTENLLTEISRLQKENQNFKRQIADKDAKNQSQAVLIERLMSSHEEGYHQSYSGKDKSYSQSHSQSQSVERLKKKIKQLQEEIVLMRRSQDALNRSKDITLEMQDYNEEQLQILRKEKEGLLIDNERLSAMCERLVKQAKQATKEKKRLLEMVKQKQENKSES